MSRELTGTGTAEAVWSAADRLAALPAFRPPPGPVLVVAAHPDDEVLAVGALLGSLAADITVAVLTDGEASHPGSPTLAPDELAARRVLETEQARAELGLRRATVLRAQLPDSGLAEVEDDAAAFLAGAIGGAAWCLSVWSEDGHPDHDAAGRAAARAAGVAGVPLVEYPVWMWHWSTPEDGAVPWERARSVGATAVDRDRKRAAIAQLVTQTQPLSEAPADRAILPRHVLDRFVRDVEVVFV